MNRQHLMASLLLAASAAASASVTSPVIGKLLWSDEFNGATLDTRIWTASNGNGCQIGLCGYGNQELEYYHPDNLGIANVPFEPGTRELSVVFTPARVGSFMGEVTFDCDGCGSVYLDGMGYEDLGMTGKIGAHEADAAIGLAGSERDLAALSGMESHAFE